MEIITLTVTGQAMTRSTGIPVSMGTVQKERARLNITSFLALWTHDLSPRPPASPRPCTMKTARAASSRERSLIHTRITAQTRPTTTSSATQPKPPPAPIPAGLPMMPASARAAAIPPMRKFRPEPDPSRRQGRNLHGARLGSLRYLLPLRLYHLCGAARAGARLSGRDHPAHLRG